MVEESMLRRDIVRVAQALIRHGLNHGTSGNVSVRCDDVLLVTPSGVACDALTPESIATIPLTTDGAWTGPLKPSSEWRFHRDILRARPDACAIVHTHATYCTVFAMLRENIPAAHYMIAAFGGPDVRCTAYAPYGTQALSDLAVEGLRDRQAVLLGSHGMITLGRDLDEALWRAVELETLAKQVYLARAIGRPVILDDEEIMRTVERFKGYGQRAQETAPPNSLT
jgi:L-fuculose-phosphate aldolase